MPAPSSSLTLPPEVSSRAQPAPYDLPGANIMLVGGSGTGKTHSIRTLCDAGLEVFVLFTEPGMEVLADVPADKLHWHYIKPASPSFEAMIDSAKKINTFTMKMLSELTDINKSKYGNFIDILSSLSSFTCDRTGKNYGCVENWKSDRVIVIDSLSGLSIAAMNLGTGSKPVKSMSDWGIAMDNLERLIIKLCVDTEAVFVLTAHIERETDELTGGTSMMPSTLGRKLAPKLPRFFSDVVHVKRIGTKFSWSTTTANVDLKARNLKLTDDLPPSFVPLVENWRRAEAKARGASPSS